MNRVQRFHPPSLHGAVRRGPFLALLLILPLLGAVGGRSAAHAPTTSQPPTYQSTNPQSTTPQSQPRTITYTYDGAGRLTRADYGEEGALVYYYDPSGNLVIVWPGGENFIYLPLVLRQGP